MTVHKTSLGVLMGTSLLVIALAPGAASACPPSGSTTPTPVAVGSATYDNLQSAMKGEAFANAKYLLYGEVADATKQPQIAKLFRDTASDELGDHWTTEAGYAGQVGTVEQNLRDAIEGERYETETMYPGFAAAAEAAGDTGAAELFTEIGGDEATHMAGFQTALASLSDKKVRVPAGPTLDKVAVTTDGAHASDPSTLANLDAAEHGEAMAYAKYMAYAAQAKKTGHPAIGRLFEATAQVELLEHFREEANMSGLAGTNAANLANAIAGEDYEKTTMYPDFATQAIADAQSGDDACWDVAASFLTIRSDEAMHSANFTAALDSLNSGSTPAKGKGQGKGKS